jgi:selenocysteine-specific elongation factor
VATAGHVDHGKSTLVKTLTGTDPDRWAEEKARGLTIDLGFASATLPSGLEVSFVDVPGHVRFLPNMLAGVGGIAACLFVVAATEGWKPQSEEHLRILDVLGTQTGLIALTKAGGMGVDEIELAVLELGQATAGTFLEKAEIVPVDAPSGHGVDELHSALDRLLVGTAEAEDRGRPRLWVDRSFSAAGAGTVVTGTLTGGSLKVGDQLDVVPGGGVGRVRGLQTHGRSVQEVGPGRRVAVNLAGLAVEQVGRGQALVRGSQWAPTRRLDAELRVVPGLDHPVRRRGAYRFHTGTRSAPAGVQLLGGIEQAEAGSRIPIRVRLTEEVALMPGDHFVLREVGRDETVGGGQVLDVEPVLRPSRAAPDRSVDRVVAERGWIEVDHLERLTGERRTPDLGDWVVDPEARLRAEASLRSRASGDGVALAELGEFERALAREIEGLTVVGERLTESRAAAVDPELAAWLEEAQAQLYSPPPVTGLDRARLRDLVRSGEVVESEGLYFHRSAVEGASAVVAGLLAGSPGGITASSVREALGTSRKWALPLLAHLDANGVTRRRGDLRIGGPRLPGPGGGAG